MTELDNVTSSSETEYLEWHLRNYEDMPREVILKMDLLRVGHWFTDAAWSWPPMPWSSPTGCSPTI